MIDETAPPLSGTPKPRNIAQSRVPLILKIPKEIRLLIYEYLLPYSQIIPSNRYFSYVMLVLRGADELDRNTRRLEESYSNNTWLAVLLLNRQIYDESHDLMYKKLTIGVDIYPKVCFRADRDWIWERSSVNLDKRSFRCLDAACLVVLSKPHAQVQSLAPVLSHVTRLSLGLWFIRQYSHQQSEPQKHQFIVPAAKTVKEKVNLLACVLQQMRSLRSLTVEMERFNTFVRTRHSSREEISPRSSDQTATLDWYLRPLKTLRNIPKVNLRCRGGARNFIHHFTDRTNHILRRFRWRGIDRGHC